MIQIDFSPISEELGLSSNFEILFLDANQLTAIIQYNLIVSDEIKEQIFEEGVDCKVLKYGSKE
ncbi:hypothetical protein [Dapis sp. BLCC M172]|uniref:hypothetical protein n=1 Tax=Dapis sp. BLCC M172 TaxID=2975281 RepID=UPI003CEC6684